VDAGAYRYTLRQQGNDWYLAKPDVNTPDQDPQDPVNPPPDENPQQPVNPPVVDNPQVPPISQPPTTSKPANRPQIPQSHTLS
ncbi:autotransporter outer membrane beta-barrel domain-containing protein, partial [Paraburkholderia sp. SIMBA_049]